ncbi:MAG: DUF3667 domain-containing protein [Bacteroidota bacterium]
MICKNCHHEFEGNFCSHCGQKASVRRLDFKYLVRDVPNSVFQLNRGFFFTAKEILVRPGQAVRNFVAGQRQPYYKPIAFLIVVSTIYILIHYFVGGYTLVEDFLLGVESGATAQEEISDTAFAKWLTKYQLYVPLMVLPFFSVASYLAFIKSRYNYVEHLVLNVYITAQQFMIFMVFAFITRNNSDWVVIPFLIGIAYVFWTYIQFFDDKKLIRKIALILLTYVYFFIFTTVTIFAVGIIIGLLQ